MLGVTSHEFVFNAEDVESGTSGFAGAEIVEAYSTASGPSALAITTMSQTTTSSPINGLPRLSWER